MQLWKDGSSLGPTGLERRSAWQLSASQAAGLTPGAMEDKGGNDRPGLWSGTRESLFEIRSPSRTWR